ncbi:MAG: CPBP family intramembrane metalloprotease [Cellvibrio sp.]|nr:CPBP family intramembrane metalloprotease [Cellvibrio sp.]
MSALDTIDQEYPSHSFDKPKALRRTLITLAAVSISLLFLHYAKYTSSFYIFLSLIESTLNLPEEYFSQSLAQSQWHTLIEYAWWTSCHLLAFILIPVFVIKFLFKDAVANFGWRWQQTHQHWAGYCCLILPILCFVYIASLGTDFINHYPFYKLTHRSYLDFIFWEILYLTQFVCLEFFFRGFMLQALKPALDANAIWIICVPYMMIHLPKLWPEATSAILFGFFLGILAMQSRSIWGGVLVHAGIALSMDIAAMIRTNGLPTQFWP